MADEYSNLMKPWHREEDDEDPLSLTAADDAGAPGLLKQYAALSTAHRAMTKQLQDELLAYIHSQPFDFFEELILDVILALGYAGRRRDLARKIGRSGDGGVDGIIELDELGLDAIYLQAKRLKPGSNVSSPAVRDFIGSLETKRANKGIFVTTADFTASAREASEGLSKRVVLINGNRLTEMMIRHLIGIRVTESFQFKQIDIAYFQDRVKLARGTSAATHPRR